MKISVENMICNAARQAAFQNYQGHFHNIVVNVYVEMDCCGRFLYVIIRNSFLFCDFHVATLKLEFVNWIY